MYQTMGVKGENSVRKLQKSPSGDFCGEMLLSPLLGVGHKQPGDGGGGHVLLDRDADVPHLGDVEVFGPHAVAVGVEHKLMDHADAHRRSTGYTGASARGWFSGRMTTRLSWSRKEASRSLGAGRLTKPQSTRPFRSQVAI